MHSLLFTGLILPHTMQYITNTNLWVALNATALAGIAYVRFSLEGHLYLAVVLGGSLAIYYYARIFETSRESTKITYQNRPDSLHPHARYWALAGLAVVAVGYFSLGRAPLLYLLPGVAVAMLYPLPIRLGWRYWPGAKWVLIASTWTWVTAIVPLLLDDKGIMPQHGFYIMQNFCFVGAITIPFDVRDTHSDRLRFTSLPHLIGMRGSLWLASGLMVLAALFLVSEVILTDGVVVSLSGMWPQLGVMVFALFLIRFAGPARRWWYFSWLMEAMPLLWFLSHLLG